MYRRADAEDKLNDYSVNTGMFIEKEGGGDTQMNMRISLYATGINSASGYQKYSSELYDMMLLK
jgi:hypothetical protein